MLCDVVDGTQRLHALFARKFCGALLRPPLPLTTPAAAALAQAYVDAAEAHLAHLESVGTPQRPSDVLNALVLRKACKAFALYHCNSAAARLSPHVVVAMLGAMDRVKQLVSQELAADKQAAIDAAASKRTLLVDPPGPESDLARLFTTSEDRTGAAVRLWYAAGCSADEFVDRLDATNLSVLVRCLQSLAPADAARTGTQRRALALPPHEAFGGVFAKVRWLFVMLRLR